MEFITSTWNELDEPCAQRTIGHALACEQRRLDAHDDERAVLVHGDVQQWNALRADGRFKLVDRMDDATAIFEWGVVERVSTELLATKIDLQPAGRQMLALADRLTVPLAG